MHLAHPRRPAGAAALALALAFAAALAASACGTDREQAVVPVSLSDGTYRAVGVPAGLPAGDQAALLAVTVRLDRAAGTLALTRQDGSQQTLSVSFRPRSRWAPDCFTMGGHALDEVADLAPAPLQVGPLILSTPLIHAKCSPTRLVLADQVGETGGWLALELEP